jgi:hypothetical protein
MSTDVENTKARNGPPMSLEAASRLFDWSSIALAIGACIVFVATAVIVWLGIVKEHHWDALRERANEKIASVELEAAKSNAEAAKAHERIAELSIQAEELKNSTAEANARAIEAQLALEKFKTPRKLDDAQVARVKAIAARFPGTPFDVSVNLESEPQNFASQLGFVLEGAGWLWKNRNNTPGISIKLGPHEAGMLNGGPALGLEIDVSKSDEWAIPLLAIGNALQEEGFLVVMNRAMDNSASPDAVHLYVGSKR